jgi:hypothetical protein
VLVAALLLGAAGLTGGGEWLRARRAHFGASVLVVVLVASLPGDRVLWLFLRAGITEIEPAREQAFFARLAQDYPGIRVARGSLFSEQEFAWLDGELGYGQGDLIFVLHDFNDAYKARYLPELLRRFRAVPVAEYHGTFADYPPCALSVFHGHRLVAYRLKPR